MAGIAGIIFPDAFQVDQTLFEAIKTLSHRGEEENQIVTFKNIQVGICGSRLTTYEHIIVGLDGTLFGIELLKSVLKENGYHPDLASSTELIALAYDFWGSTFLEHIDGNFALFILDQKKESILLARDRIGKKPLYWYQDSRILIWGSELKALLATGAIPQTPDLDAIASYLYFGYIPQDFSPIQGINKLLPGYYLQYNQNKSISTHPYWSYAAHFRSNTKESPQEIVHNVNSILEEAVKERIPKQRPLGCFLSGGLGSASIAYYLQKNVSSEQIKAFNVSYQEQNIADLQAAQEAARDLNLNYSYDIITPQTLLKDIVKIAWYLDEPVADPNIIATWRLTALAKEHTQFIFSGMGSDEFLAGHNRYTTEEQKSTYLNRAIQLGMPFIRSFLLPIINVFSKTSTYGILQQGRANPWQIDYLNQNALFTKDILKAAAPRLDQKFNPQVFLHRFPHLAELHSPVSSYLYIDVKTRLVDNYILQYERMTTAHNLEWQTPYLSKDIIEYLAKIPEPYVLESSKTSFILKEILKNKLPPTFINRPKRTRKEFLSTWVVSSGLFNIFQKLPNGSLVDLGIISGSWLKAQVKTPEQCRLSFRYLWSILMLEIWYHLFINKSVDQSAPEITLEELFKDL